MAHSKTQKKEVLMKLRHAVFPVVLLGLLLFITGCDNNKSPQTTTVEFVQPEAQTTEGTKNQELGSGIRVKFITAQGSHDQMQADVQRQLEAFINGGQYEIVRVVTTRCNGEQAHLLSAEVYYRSKK